MRRFYREAAADRFEGGRSGAGGDGSTAADWTVLLDGRSVRTPARAPLVLPTRALAEAVAAEWSAQAETIQPARMPLTGLANAALDRVAPDPAAHVSLIAAYGETDLVCYRAEAPAELVAAEAVQWDPLVRWAMQRYDVSLRVASGVMHRPQPASALARLRAAVAELEPFRLAALQSVVTVTGSLVIGLAVVDGALSGEAAWTAGHVDELYQAGRWGEDPLAAESRANRRASLDAAVRLLALLDEPG